MKGAGMLVVSLRGVNFGFWSHLGCSGPSTIIGLFQGCTRRIIKKLYILNLFYLLDLSNQSLTWSLLGVKKERLGHAQIGLLQGFNSKFQTSIPASFIWESPARFVLLTLTSQQGKPAQWDSRRKGGGRDAGGGSSKRTGIGKIGETAQQYILNILKSKNVSREEAKKKRGNMKIQGTEGRRFGPPPSFRVSYPWTLTVYNVTLR